MISNDAAVLTVQLNSLLHGFKSVFLLSIEANIFFLCQRGKSDYVGNSFLYTANYNPHSTTMLK